MATGGDVQLGTGAYAIVPGSYRRWGAATGEEGRRAPRQVVIDEFGGGMLQAVHRDGARSWYGTGVHSTVGGQGVEPWFATSVNVETNANWVAAPPLVGTRPAFGVVAGNQVYIGCGRYLYRTGNLTDTSWSNLTTVADMGAGSVISGVAAVRDEVVIGLGSAVDAKKYVPSTATTSVWRSGERATELIAYQDSLIYAPKTPAFSGNPNNTQRVKMGFDRYNGNAATDQRWVDSAVVRFGLFEGKVAIATKTSLFLLGGQGYPGQADDATMTGDQSKASEWTADPEPVFSHGMWTAEGDFGFLQAFQGRLYTWVANRVHYWDGVGTWQRTPVDGVSCYGGVVSAGYLVVSVKTRSGGYDIWATDGDGWWRVFGGTSAATARVFPIAVNGVGNQDVMLLRDGAATYEMVRLMVRSVTQGAYSQTGSWVSSLIDDGRPAVEKAWGRYGAQFTWPEHRGNAATSDQVTLTVSLSFDCGVTWPETVTIATVPGADRDVVLTGKVSGSNVSRQVQVKVDWASVLDAAPVLTSVWVECEDVVPGSVARAWEFEIEARDEGIAPSRAAMTRTGKQTADDVWAAWAAGTVVSFVDFDTTTARDVVVESIEELVPRPADEQWWRNSRVRVRLRQVK